MYSSKHTHQTLWKTTNKWCNDKCKEFENTKTRKTRYNRQEERIQIIAWVKETEVQKAIQRTNKSGVLGRDKVHYGHYDMKKWNN